MALVKKRKKQTNENATKNNTSLQTAEVDHTEKDESFTIIDGNSVKTENHLIITSGHPLFGPEGATLDTTEASSAQGIETETTTKVIKVRKNEDFFSIHKDTSINIPTIAKTTMEGETNTTEAANPTNTNQTTSIENSFDLFPSINSTTRPIIVDRFWTTVAEATTSTIVTPGKTTDTITETTTNSNKEDINATLANDITSINIRTMETTENDETTEKIFYLSFDMTENSALNTDNSTNKNKVTAKHSTSPSPNIASIAVSHTNISTKADNAIKLGPDITTSFITVFTEPTVWDASTDSNPSELTKKDALSGEDKKDISVGKTSEETNQASMLEEAEVQVFRWLLQLLPAGTQSEPRP